MRQAKKASAVVLASVVWVAVSSSSAALSIFNSTSIENNQATMNAWLSAIGGSVQYTVDFENVVINNPADTQIEGNTSLFPNLVFADNYGGDSVYVSDDTDDFGTSLPGPPPSTKAVYGQGSYLILTFTTPVDYVSFFDIDISDDAGMYVTYADGRRIVYTDEQNESGYSSGNSATFYGFWRNDMPQITQVEFYDTGGDGEWGLDEIRYGVIPEPVSAALLAAGGLLHLAGIVPGRKQCKSRD